MQAQPELVRPTFAVTVATALAVFGLANAFTASAQAASVELSGDRLTISGTDDKERLQLERKGERFEVTQLGSGATLESAGASCTTEAPSRLSCPAAGVETIVAATRAGNDRFVVGRSFPSSDERGGCRGNQLGAELLVRTGDGRDYAELSDGDDLAVGGGQADVLLGCQGGDQLRGGGGGDRLSGDKNDDSLKGGKGNDWLIGCSYDPDDVNYPRNERGADALRGGPGSDFLYGCDGTDDYKAGKGKDAVNARDKTAERVSCGGQLDIAYVDPSDRLRSCERPTNCTTDNFPFYPCASRFGTAGSRETPGRG